MLLTEPAALLTERFIRHDNPTSEQELFDIAVAQAESAIQPHPMADDLGWEAVVLVTAR
jgi:hypothetical protein